ncbi:PHP domain-containing protein [Candidatus Woesearchaeota archaeon]|nr:PHP domain-containing protein [Candidatus Woesearchaeota archaeon]
MLKTDFHIHTGEDPYDPWIKYSAREMINHAAKLGFEILSITNHHKIHYNKELAYYAKKKGILLIPGVETHINGKEVLLLNVKKPGKVNDFSGLEKLRNENVIVIAPHPFYPFGACLRQDLINNIKYFDGIEYSHFYLNSFNIFNKKAVDAAKRYNKTLVGTSDAHKFSQFNYTYSLVDCNKNIDSVFEAIKKGKVQIRSRRISYRTFSRVFFSIFFNGFRRTLSSVKFDNSYD